MIHTIFTPIRLSLLLVLSVISPAVAQFDTPGTASGLPGAQADPAVIVSAEVSTTQAAPGDTLVLAVILDHKPGWHTNLNEPVVPKEMEGFFPVATTIIAKTPDSLVQGPVQWPKQHAVEVDFMMTGNPVEFLVFDGSAIAFIPLKLTPDAVPGTSVEIPVTVGYQSCDDQVCLPPTKDTVRVSFQIVERSDAATSMDSGVFSGFDPTVFDDPSRWSGSDSTAQTQPTTADSPISSSPSGSLLGLSLGSGLITLALGSFLGGMILNLTPCVLPVIPIKVLTLTQHAGGDRKKTMLLGAAMAAGVVAFWLALGIPTALVTSIADPSRLFGFWFVTIPIGAIIVLLALGLMGLFTLSLPQSAYRFEPKADNIGGSFLFGVMTGVLGLPCFGVAAGGIIPIAASLGQTATVVIFAAIGLGMAAPYLVLAAFPQLLNRVPKTGPGSELVKQFLGLLLAGFGLFFFGTGVRALVKTYPYTADVLHLYALAALTIAAGLWLAYQTLKITKSPVRRGVFGLIGLGLAFGTVYFVTGSTNKHRLEYQEREQAMLEAGGPGAILKAVWNEYTPALLDRIEEQGMVAFIDFTADWCINCKVFEAQVLNRDPIRSLLRSDDIAMVKVDLTGSNKLGNQFLKDLGRVGIPTWAVIGPGLDEPMIVSGYTSAAVSSAIQAARGNSMARDR